MSYTITYSVDNKILENVNDTREFGASLDKLYPYTKTGYTVSEWTQSDGSQPPTAMPARQVYLYATTTPISYTISYQLNGGTNAESNPASYTVESGKSSWRLPAGRIHLPGLEERYHHGNGAGHRCRQHWQQKL